MHGEPRGFVDHNQAGLIKQYGFFQHPAQLLPGNGLLRLLGDTDRRNPDHIAALQAILSFHPSFIYAHLSLAENPVNSGSRHAFKARLQVIVDPLTGKLRRHGKKLDASGLPLLYRAIWRSGWRLSDLAVRSGLVVASATGGLLRMGRMIAPGTTQLKRKD